MSGRSSETAAVLIDCAQKISYTVYSTEGRQYEFRIEGSDPLRGGDNGHLPVRDDGRAWPEWAS
jgi:hypothetical protein